MRVAGDELHEPLDCPAYQPGANLAGDGDHQEQPQDMQAGDHVPCAERDADEVVDHISEVADIRRQDAAERCEHGNDEKVPGAEVVFAGHRDHVVIVFS